MIFIVCASKLIVMFFYLFRFTGYFTVLTYTHLELFRGHSDPPFLETVEAILFKKGQPQLFVFL